MNLQAAIREATERLRAAGVASPEHDARALAAHSLGLAKPSDLARYDEIDLSAYGELVTRRASRVPLQHLIGRVGFRWIDLEVGPGVFIPRPETETVVQWALDALPPVADFPLSPAPGCWGNGKGGGLVVDLCAGSGAIALSIAHERPEVTVHAVELDPEAFRWAERNANTRQRAGDNAITLHLGAVQGCLPELDGTVDLVISNPPYVPWADRDRMEPEVLDHDPSHAVFADDDGLAVICQIEQAARRLLRPGGVVVIEHADSQGSSAPGVFGDGWSDVQDHVDLTGRDRFVTARWTP
jgi:release factor glutamine methyltransferase